MSAENTAAAGPMKVLVVHNHYQFRGGEDSVVDAEMALLRSRGHEVRTYLRHNDDIKTMPRLSAATQTLWSARSKAEVTALLAEFKPAVMHVHNTFPLVSPSVYSAAASAGVPVVQTLHNFRLACPQAMFLRNGKVCEDCVGHVPWRGVVRACFRDSVAQSAVLAGMLTLHRGLGTWNRQVTRYIALNEFCRRKFIQAGLPADRIAVKPNFIDAPELDEQPRSGFLFVGRLSQEKGIAVLADAVRLAANAPEVRVAGIGPDAAQLDAVPGLLRLGSLGEAEVRRHMSSACMLLLPSIWYENFPRTLVEAFACGLPVLASRIGALAELVEDGVDGLLFEPGNAADMAQKMQWAAANPAAVAAMGQRARARYLRQYTAGINYQQLLAVYGEAIAATGR